MVQSSLASRILFLASKCHILVEVFCKALTTVPTGMKYSLSSLLIGFMLLSQVSVHQPRNLPSRASLYMLQVCTVNDLPSFWALEFVQTRFTCK